MGVPTPQVITPDINAAVGADIDAAVAAATGLILMGYTARESDGTPATASARIVNGATGAAAGKIAEIGLVANDSKAVWFGPHGIPCPLGLSIDWIDGTLDVILYHRTAP